MIDKNNRWCIAIHRILAAHLALVEGAAEVKSIDYLASYCINYTQARDFDLDALLHFYLENIKFLIWKKVQPEQFQDYYSAFEKYREVVVIPGGIGLFGSLVGNHGIQPRNDVERQRQLRILSVEPNEYENLMNNLKRSHEDIPFFIGEEAAINLLRPYFTKNQIEMISPYFIIGKYPHETVKNRKWYFTTIIISEVIRLIKEYTEEDLGDPLFDEIKNDIIVFFTRTSKKAATAEQYNDNNNNTESGQRRERSPEK